MPRRSPPRRMNSMNALSYSVVFLISCSPVFATVFGNRTRLVPITQAQATYKTSPSREGQGASTYGFKLTNRCQRRVPLRRGSTWCEYRVSSLPPPPSPPRTWIAGLSDGSLLHLELSLVASKAESIYRLARAGTRLEYDHAHHPRNRLESVIQPAPHEPTAWL